LFFYSAFLRNSVSSHIDPGIIKLKETLASHNKAGVPLLNNDRSIQRTIDSPKKTVNLQDILFRESLCSFFPYIKPLPIFNIREKRGVEHRKTHGLHWEYAYKTQGAPPSCRHNPLLHLSTSPYLAIKNLPRFHPTSGMDGEDP
jgi:hypothetical protein